MIRRSMLAWLVVGGLWALSPRLPAAQPGHAPETIYPNGQAFGRNWSEGFSGRDYDRFYHYPYVYYPQNFWSHEYFRSRNHLYYRYPPEMRVPVYNKQWFNYYPQPRKYHKGHHFILDQF
jgi:hypothetical protein